MSLTYNQAVEQTITVGEQIHQIVNGTATTEVTVEDGSKVPSIRKALLDNFYFKDPIVWQVGQTENVFNQLRQFTDGSWWYAPSATASNPVSMGSTPVGDVLWKIYDFDAIGKLTPQIREALRRSYAEAGYNLVDGSFEAGGTVTSVTDVLLYEATGIAYLWLGALPKVVPAGSTPASTGGIDSGAWVKEGGGYVNQAQEEIINGKIFPESGVLSNGMTVPTGTTHLRILVGSTPTIVKLQKNNATDDLPTGGAVTLNTAVRPYTCVINGDTFYLGRLPYKKTNPLFFWAVGDYMLFNGSINPNPTDDTECVQAAINMTNTNGAVDINAFFYCTSELMNHGVLTMRSPMVPSMYRKASLGVAHKYGIANHTTDLFDFDPANAQVSFHFTGIDFYGNGTSNYANDATNGLVKTEGKTPIVDYFHLQMHGCATQKITGIDGSLGSWLWVFTYCGFAGSVIALDLYQPHGAVIEKCGFGFRNKQDIRTYGGTALTIRDNAMDFDVAYKEIGMELRLLQGCEVYGNYSEQYNSSGKPLVNDGRGTDVVILEPGHYVPNSMPVFRNNYFAASFVQRLITLRRAPSEEGFYTRSDLAIRDLTINGIGGDVIYHDHSGLSNRTLTISKPRIQASQNTEYTIGDPTGSLRFKGEGAVTIVDYVAVNPGNGINISTASPNYLRNDKNFNERTDGWGFESTGTEITLDFTWNRSDAQQFYIEVTTSGGGFVNKKIYQTGSEGSATFHTILPYGQGGAVNTRLRKISTYAGAVVDNLYLRATIRSIQR